MLTSKASTAKNYGLGSSSEYKTNRVIKLQQAELMSFMNFYDITEYTWLGHRSESQINDFWISRDKVEERNLVAKMIDNTATLNTIWNTWDNLVKAEANKHIPFTYSAQKTFHSHTFKATNIHRGLTLVNKILKCIKSPDGPITLCQLEIKELAPDDLCTANYFVTGQKFRIIRNMLFITRKLEIQKSKSESINFYINRRHNNFASNTTKMIDSVLSKHKTAITYHNLVTLSEVITDPEEILEATQKHFCTWTRYNPCKEELW
ncbi:35961_t:CDS:2 [Gigaspora margarita]|uniref:35961_t:CDS:1 n=1 Tax=Gigaspora margarita TaxID=4874 RepID=A0ABN7UBY1_GIGMA|nr:35961_t:CDS:2 [Gigaspora margarita]